MYQYTSMPNHRYAQCHIEHTDDGIFLFSYSTMVCAIDNDGYLNCTGLYSRTTISHIGWFARYYTDLTYQEIKKAYLGNYRIHIHHHDIIFN